jgi:hypothetical protein
MLINFSLGHAVLTAGVTVMIVITGLLLARKILTRGQPRKRRPPEG